MAEQSIGMSSGSGDGTAGGYTADRMRDMELRTFGEGVLQNNDGTEAFELGGAGTNALTIAEGNAVVNGWFYQNTTPASISVATGVPNATYSLVIVANNSALTPAVQKTAAGVATVPAYSVRLALVTAAQVSVIQAAGQYVFYLASSVVVSGGNVSSFSMDISTIYSTARNTPYQTGTAITGGTVTATTANTTYDVVNYSSGAATVDDILRVNLTTGVITVRREGWYNVTGMVVWGTGTTSWRRVTLNLNGAQNTRIDQVSSGLNNHYMVVNQQLFLSAGDLLKMTVASGLAAQVASSASLTVTLV